MLMIATVLIIAFGFAFRAAVQRLMTRPVSCCSWRCGFGLSGLAYGPLGSALATCFPPRFAIRARR